MKSELLSSGMRIVDLFLRRLASRTAILAALVGVTLPAARLYAQESDGDFEPTFHPFLWVQTSYMDSEAAGRHSTFQAKRTRFGMKGKVDEPIGYHFMMEGVLSGKDPSVMQAWIDYRLHYLAHLRVGQFKYPFGIEAYPGFITWKFINPSFVTGAVTKELGRRNPGQSSGLFRDIGVQLSGDHLIIGGYEVAYQVMAMNGNGILRSDDNDEKDIVVRGILATPLNIRAGVSYFSGTFESAADAAGFDESALGVDLSYRKRLGGGRRLDIQGEYILGRYETAGEDLETRGFYLYASYVLVPGFQAGLRYDSFEPDGNSARTVERKRTTLATTYHIRDRQQIDVNYEIVSDDLKQADNTLTAQFQIAF